MNPLRKVREQPLPLPLLLQLLLILPLLRVGVHELVHATGLRLLD
jgi:hypothetical protein